MSALGHPAPARLAVHDAAHDGNAVLLAGLDDRLTVATPADDAAFLTSVVVHATILMRDQPAAESSW